MSLKSNTESFPLIITEDSNDLNRVKVLDQMNEWSDQELDDLFQSPIEEVLDSMRYRSSSKISRKQCLKSVLFMSLICFVFGLSFATLFISGYNSVDNYRNLSPQLRPILDVKKEWMPSTISDIQIRDYLSANISTERIAQNLK